MRNTLALFIPIIAALTISVQANAQVVCGGTITTSTTMTANLNCTGTGGQGITIGANGVTLDGAGFTLTLDANAVGVNAANRTNVGVTNLVVVGGNVGVNIVNGDGITVADNSFTNTTTPISIANPNDTVGPLTITGNAIGAGNGWGVALSGMSGLDAANLVLGNNTFNEHAGGYVIDLMTGPYTFPNTDTFINTGRNVGGVTNYAALRVTNSSDITIDDVTTSSTQNQGFGIWLINTTRAVITNNSIHGHATAIYMEGVQNSLTVVDNDFTNNFGTNTTGIGGGTFTATSSPLTITGNDLSTTALSNTGWGIVLNLTGLNPNTDLVLENNNLSNRAGGLLVDQVTGPWTIPSTLNLNETGRNVGGVTNYASVRVTNSTDVTITGQTLVSTLNQGFGIWLINTTRAVISNNVVNGHAQALYMEGVQNSLSVVDNDMRNNLGTNSTGLSGGTFTATSSPLTITGNDLSTTALSNTGWGIALNLTGLNPNTDLVLENNNLSNRAGGLLVDQVTGPWTIPTTLNLNETGRNVGGVTNYASVRVTNATDVTITGLPLLSTLNQGFGIWLINTTRAVISNNVVNGHAQALYMEGVQNSLSVVDNDMRNNLGTNTTGLGGGTFTATSSPLTITGNDLSTTGLSNTGWGITLNLTGLNPNTDLVLENNNLSNRAGGLAIDQAVGPWTVPTSQNLTNTGRNVGGVTNYAAMRLTNASNVSIAGLDLTATLNQGFGVWLINTVATLLSNNEISGHLRGLYLEGTNSDLVVSSNTIDGAAENALHLAGAANASLTVVNNRLRSSGTGYAVLANFTNVTSFAFSGNDLTDSANGVILDAVGAQTLDFSDNDFGNAGTVNGRRALYVRNSTGGSVTGVRGDCNDVGTLFRLENSTSMAVTGVTACERNIGVELANADNVSVNGEFAGNTTGVLIDNQSTGVTVVGAFYNNGANVTDNQGGNNVTVNVMPDDDGDLIGDACDLCFGDNALGDVDEDGICGEPLVPGAALVRLTDLLVGDANCPHGGVQIDVGLDNGNGGEIADDGILDDGEVDQTGYACNGAPGIDGVNGRVSLVSLTDEDAGANCEFGGVLVETGIDLDDSGVLEPSEVTDSAYVCDGAPGGAVNSGNNALVRTTVLAIDDVDCPNGGILVEAGVDTNGNDILDVDEVTSTETVCNGADGSDGNDGSDGTDGSDGDDGADGNDGAMALVTTADIAAGDEDCAAGGVLIQAGLDDNGNGALDAAEVDSTAKVCNGNDGDDGAEGPEGPEGPAGGGCSSTTTTTGVPATLPLVALMVLALRRRRSPRA